MRPRSIFLEVFWHGKPRQSQNNGAEVLIQRDVPSQTIARLWRLREEKKKWKLFSQRSFRLLSYSRQNAGLSFSFSPWGFFLRERFPCRSHVSSHKSSFFTLSCAWLFAVQIAAKKFNFRELLDYVSLYCAQFIDLAFSLSLGFARWLCCHHRK